MDEETEIPDSDDGEREEDFARRDGGGYWESAVELSVVQPASGVIAREEKEVVSHVYLSLPSHGMGMTEIDSVHICSGITGGDV